jgi:hypothetical protein
MTTEGPSRRRTLAAGAGVALSAAGLGASGACVYVTMRDLMVRTGGVCASGGPYEIAQECGRQPFYLLFGGIIAFLVFAALHIGFTEWVDGPQIGMFAMLAALFAALGWNFIDLALDPPGTVSGAATAWMFCGVVFWLMAIGFAIPAAGRALEWIRNGGQSVPAFSPGIVEAVMRPPARPAPAAPPASRPSTAPTRLVPPDRWSPGGGS